MTLANGATTVQTDSLNPEIPQNNSDSSDPEIPFSESESEGEEEEEELREDNKQQHQEAGELEDGDEEDESESEASLPEYKMVLIVRKDLNMSGGKIAAQVSHAVHRLLQKGYRDTEEYKKTYKKVLVEDLKVDEKAVEELVVEEKNGSTSSCNDNSLSLRNICIWESTGCKKITLQVESFEELLGIRKKVKEREKSDIIPTATIRDAGHTEIPPGTTTVLGLGPCEESLLNEVLRIYLRIVQLEKAQIPA